MSNHSPAIVVGFVDSPTGWAAFEQGVAEARLRSGHLVVVHSELGGSSTSGEDAQRYRDLFEELRQRLEGEGCSFDLKTFVRGRTPAEDVCETAAESDAELLVIGYHGRSATGKAILGSDALGILRAAPCPVLAVKA